MSIASRESRVDRLRRELQEAEYELAQVRRIRANEPAAGSKVLIKATFPSDPSKTYEYLAMRTGYQSGAATWYITGVSGKTTWAEILDRVDRADYTIHPLYIS